MSSGDMRSVPYEANFKRVLEAVFWFALGHASCTVLYQLGLSRLREPRLGPESPYTPTLVSVNTTRQGATQFETGREIVRPIG